MLLRSGSLRSEKGTLRGFLGQPLKCHLEKDPAVWGVCSFMYFVGIKLIKISYTLHMVQSSKNRKMYQMKPFLLSKSPSYPVHLSPKEKVKQNNRKSFHYY